MAEYEKSVAFTTNVNQEPSLFQRISDAAGGVVTDLQEEHSLEYKPRGDATKFDRNKYKIENHSYPIDLVSDDPRYGDNYVVFYINVSEDSKYVRRAQQEDNIVEEIPTRDRGDGIARKPNSTQVITATGLTGAGYGTIFGQASGVPGGGGLTGGALGVAQGALVASESAGFTRPQKRLKTAITLHVPNTLNINYGMQWDEEGTSGFMALAEAGQIAGDVIKSLTDAVASKSMRGLGSKILQDLKQGRAAITATGLNLAPAALSALSGLAANPKKEQIFRGVDFRTFTFDYQFYPRDEKEAQSVRNIISSFKYHMHPEFKDDGNWLYVYPSEFDIYYYHGDKENLNLHRHTSCVLTNMNVNYTPQGQFTTFHDGMPTQINIALTFKELALLTKDKIEDGM